MIRGFFDLSYRPPLPKVLAGLVLPYRSESFAPIEFVIDTQIIDAEIRIAPPSSGNQELPSVLGWNILERFRIVLDRGTGEVLLQ